MSSRRGTRSGTSGKERKRYDQADEPPVAKKVKATPTVASTSGPAEPEPFADEMGMKSCASCGAELEADASFLCTCCDEQACKKCEAPSSKEPTSPYCRLCGQTRGAEAAGVAAKATEAARVAQPVPAAENTPSSSSETGAPALAAPAPALAAASLPGTGPTLVQAPAQQAAAAAEPASQGASITSAQAPAATVGPFKSKAGRKKRLGKGVRVSATRNVVYARATAAQKLHIAANLPGNHPFYGQIIAGDSKNGYGVRFDALPLGANVVPVKGAVKFLTPVEDGAEEIIPDVPDAQDQARALLDMLDAQLNPVEADEDMTGTSFADLSPSQLRTAKECEVSWKASKKWKDDNGDATWKWSIRADDDPITDCKFDPPQEFKLPEGVDFDDESKMEQVLHDKVFTNLTGTAKLLDEWAQHPNNNVCQEKYNKLKGKDEFVFHDPEHADPDHFAKEAFTVLLAGCLTPHRGVENLWKKGEDGFIDYPDFGQYYDVDMFKVFKAGMPYVFAPKEQWFAPLRDRSWDIFLPALDSYNRRHSEELLDVIILLLDESMSGWRFVVLAINKRAGFCGLGQHCSRAGGHSLWHFVVVNTTEGGAVGGGAARRAEPV